MQQLFEFQLLPRVLFKPGLAISLAAEVSRCGGRRAIIVTDEGVANADLLEPIQRGLAEAVEVAAVYSAVPANPTLEVVEAATELARSCGADMVVAIGGGSPIDAAKCVRLLLSEGGRLRDYQDALDLTRPLLPMVAIPTTAGSGSEVTSFALIRDERQMLKISFCSPYMAPSLAILDPLLTVSLPPLLTAATGLDALTHAIEAFVSARANPLGDSLAIGAVEIISNYLRQATFEGTDLEARSQMLIASCMAGIASSSSLLGIVNALSFAIEGHFPAHHGTINAVLLPHVMRYNSVVAPERFSRIARMLGVNIGGRSRQEVIDDGISSVETLVRDLGLPTQLRQADIPFEAIDKLAELALTNNGVVANPVPPTIEDLQELLRTAW
jgi:alcohol dehydrogenase class IV